MAYIRLEWQAAASSGLHVAPGLLRFPDGTSTVLIANVPQQISTEAQEARLEVSIPGYAAVARRIRIQEETPIIVTIQESDIKQAAPKDSSSRKFRFEATVRGGQSPPGEVIQS